MNWSGTGYRIKKNNSIIVIAPIAKAIKRPTCRDILTHPTIAKGKRKLTKFIELIAALALQYLLTDEMLSTAEAYLPNKAEWIVPAISPVSTA